MRKNIVVMLLLCLAANSVRAQVSLQSGAATFDLPIFGWQDHNSRLNLAISLVYNSGGGLKTDDVASSIGQGWNLQSGGVITRLQAGEPDDQKPREGDFSDQKKYPAGLLYSRLPVACPTNLSKYPIYQDRNRIYSQHNSTRADREVDMFAFSFNGKSGLFVVAKDNSNRVTWINDENAKLKGWFEIDESLVNQKIRTTITAFFIQDENGIIYKFRHHGLTKVLKSGYCDAGLNNEMTQPDFKGNRVYNETSFDKEGEIENPYVINSWFLSEIEDPLTHRKVLLSYENRIINLARAGTEISYNQSGDYCIVTHKKSSTIAPAITSVIYPDGHEVAFTYDKDRVDLVGDKALASIDVRYNYRYLSRFKLTTSYFILNRYGTPKTDYQKSSARLCLLEVKKYGVDLKNDFLPYRFDYYTGSDAVDDIVPPPFSHMKDIWGFYNGSNSCASDGAALPLTKPLSGMANYELRGLCFFRDNAADHMPYNTKPGYAKNGLLRQVVYASGASMRFEYEQNTATLGGQVINAGGVHVSRTSSSDGGGANDCNNPIITDYKYVISSGSAIPSLWGVEAPINELTFESNFEAEYKAYKYSFPIGKCYWKYKYPGITSKDASTSLTGAQQVASVVATVLNVGSTAKTVLEVVNLIKGLSGWGSGVTLLISGILDIALTCIGPPPSKLSSTHLYYNMDLNAVNPLPIQFKRVEVYPGKNGASLGKTVHEFTSSDDFVIWKLSNPTLSSNQRYPSWAYGLPLRITVYDNAGVVLKQTENEYQFLIASVKDGPHALMSCKCFVKKNSSQRNTNWENAAVNPEYVEASTSDMLVDKQGVASGACMLTKTSERTYHNGEYLEESVSFAYNEYFLPKETVSTDAYGITDRTITRYCTDFNNGATLTLLKDNHVIATPVSVARYRECYIVYLNEPYVDTVKVLNLLSESVIEYTTLSNGDIKAARKLEQRFAKPATADVYQGPGTQLPAAMVEVESLIYNSKGMLAGVRDEGGRNVTNLYGYNDRYIIASVLNADILTDKVAYTSFETDAENVQGGNGWTIPAGGSYTTKAITGERSLMLNNAFISAQTTTEKPYKLSFWMAQGTPIVNVNGGTASLVTSVEGPDGFVYYEYEIAIGSSNVSVTGAGMIDELRLYPQTARMRTVTYDPAIDKTSDCDENNRITYYEYDDFGKLRFVRNENKDILKMYEHNQTSKHGGCPELFYNHPISETFIRSNCQEGYVGGSIVYTIPARKYSSSISQADADRQVEEELESLGQEYANVYGPCHQLYYNDVKTYTGASEGCPVGYVGSTVTYTVPAKKYSSLINKDDADRMAQEDIDANAEAYITKFSTCVRTSEPDYEATGPEECEGDRGGMHTGHRMVEVIDVNPNSPTYNKKRMLDLGENTSVCPKDVRVYYELTSLERWWISLQNNETGKVYSFFTTQGETYGELGVLPTGTYSIYFYPSNTPFYGIHYFYAGCQLFGPAAGECSAENVYISDDAECNNTIIISDYRF